jgi:hypothetical protein
MNHNCHGTFFSVKRRKLYYCLWDGEVVENAINGEDCPNCHRTIAAQDVGECKTEPVEHALVPGIGRIEVPNTKAKPAVSA